MVIFNEKEMKSPYTVQESRIIDIRSPLSIQDVITKLQKGEELNSDEVAITCYRYNDKELTFSKSTDHPEPNTKNIFNEVLTDEQVDEIYDIPYVRPNEFKLFELYNFGQEVAAEFKPEDISSEDLLVELKAAMGCLPTLINESLEVDEILKYSSAGKQLIRPDYPISIINPCPTIQEIDHFISMNDYEKRLITSGRVHPYRAFKSAETLKHDIASAYILNQGIYNHLYTHRNESLEDFMNWSKQEYVSEALSTKIKETFEEEYNFSPRVANEYIYGKLIMEYGKYSNKFRRDHGEIVELLDVNIKPYIKSFNRTSVSKVANTKNPWLLAISDKINFAEISYQIKDVLSVYLTLENSHTLYQKGFIEWLQANKNVRPADLVKLIEDCESIIRFDIGKSAETLIYEAKNSFGMSEAEKFAEEFTVNGQRYDFANNELAIKGRHLVAKQGNIVMRMLQADDYANFTIGYDTNCCQHFGNAGESCVLKYTSDPFAGAVVIEEKGKVKAQGFIWTDEVTSTLVFDNIEFAGNNTLDTQLAAKYLNIIYEWARECPYKNVHIGTGYNASMRGWGKKVTYEATLPTTLDGRTTITSWGNRNCYSDYHADARAIKTDGEMVLKRTNSVPIQIETAEDEPTRWDELAKPETSFMLNDYRKTPEERIEFARQFNNNPTPELQMEVIKVYPRAIAALTNPAPDVQMYILNYHPELVELVQNKIPLLRNKDIYDHPENILKMENPDDELIEIAASGNGLLIQHFPNANASVYEAGVRQNGMAIQFVPEDKRTENLQNLAVMNEPRAIATYDNPCISAVLIALEKEPGLISILKNPTQEAKLVAIEHSPELVLGIKNPVLEGETQEEHNGKIKELWTKAVSSNGYLIRNCGRTFPDLRTVAIQQNPYTIGCLPDASREEVDMAVRIDPKVYMFIKNKEMREYGFEKAKEIHGERNVPKRKVYIPPEPVHELEHSL